MKTGGGGGNRTRSLTAYEAAAFPTPQFVEGKMARRPGAAPDSRSFGGSAAQAGARRVLELKMVRSTGVAPASPDWHSGILLLNDERD